MVDDTLIASLEAERASLETRLDALNQAIAALTGTRPANTAPRSAGVGEDKLAAVREYIRKRGKVRQAEIASALSFNTGTVSTATHALMLAGEIERGPKENRSVTWRAVD